VEYLRIKGYEKLEHIYFKPFSLPGDWRDSTFFRFNGDWKILWDKFIGTLKRLGIQLSLEDDKLTWIYSLSGSVDAKSAYSQLMADKGPMEDVWWDLKIWKWTIPCKIKCFFWLLLNHRVLTWDVMCRRGWIGPGYCILCKQDVETAAHLFIHCLFTQQIWKDISRFMGIPSTWRQNSLRACFTHWVNNQKLHPALPLFICWGVWLHKNRCLFEDTAINPVSTALKIVASYKEYWTQPMRKLGRQLPPFTCDYKFVGFFDRAALERNGGCGFILYINEDHCFHGWMGISSCTNNMAELTALWCLLFWAMQQNVKELKILGDSLLVINWLSGKSKIFAKNLTHRCLRIMELTKKFELLNYEHIFREHNMEAYILSKKGIGCSEGLLQVDEYIGGSLIRNTKQRIF